MATTEPTQQKVAATVGNLVKLGHGDPNGVEDGPTGATFHNLDGGASATLWVKESSPTPDTGWVAK